MDFKEYQQKTKETAVYPDIGKNFVYPTLGLVGESGEVAEKVKKIIRDSEGILDDKIRDDLKKELGDVLWYLSQVSTELGLSLDDVAETNISKLTSRKERGVVRGSGDDR